MPQRDRPISPHLQVYRWHLTMATSILHRASGVLAGIGGILLVWWLLAVAAGPEAYGAVQAFYDAWYGRIVLFGVSLSVIYHLLNGIRHLFWDAGKGFALDTAFNSGVAVFVGTVVLTLLLWAYGYWAMGGWS